MSPAPTPSRRRTVIGRALRRAVIGWIAVLIIWLAGQHLLLGATAGTLAGSIIVYLLGGLILAALLLTLQREQTRATVETIRSEVQRRIATTDLSPLPPAGTEDLDPLIDELNHLFRMAQQRVTVTSTITSAVRSQVEESHRDLLTGLYNRAYLNNHLADEIGRTKALGDELSLMMLDVDHFKNYNDTNGHPLGDQVLRGVAEILTKTTRAIDVCIRYGGEEFTIVLPRTSHERARQIAERIRQTVMDHPFLHGELQPGGHLTVSLGIASFPRHAKSATDLISRADEALYAAKQAGRNRAVSADERPPSPPPRS